MAFNTNTILKLTGLTTRQVDYWDRTHFIKPSLKEASGYAHHGFTHSATLCS